MGNKSQFKDASGQELLDRIIEEINEPEFMVMGAVNIHTQQSQSLLSALGESYAH